MKSNADKLRQKTPQHKQTKRRKYVRKAKLLLPILGGICLFMGLLMLLTSLFMKTPVIQHRWQFAASAYAGVGCLLFLIRALLGLATGWRARRKRAVRAETAPE